ncbi:phytanoyl-CoA dioxygenase family protein [Catenulispora sp. NF23]|uniref:phytanoyl-CoA dioxygenase family protein n=1 Tax=Catenulispora pinistramenti TaxID=2705254 RepID=UPI001BAE299A|nr:phytanoyl-CoA dioxygenase family protein [Catenulispora pinistramenti]MBS2539580.1 phytanoyl-CoA dioxygenase family protein [Catenulispora pinistramenti]
MPATRFPDSTGVLTASGLTSNGYRLAEDPGRLGRLEPVLEADRADARKLRRRLAHSGCLYLPGLLDPDLVLDFRRHYFAALASAGLIVPGTDPVSGTAADKQSIDQSALRRILFQEVVPGPEYEALCRTPALVQLFAKLFETDRLHLHRRKIIRHVGPGESGIGTATQAHYDLVYLREGTDHVLSAWIPLGDVPLARGPLIYLEGSHGKVRAQEAAGTLKRPAASMTADLPALADDHDARWLVTGFRAGDVMIHTAHVIHASLDNRHPDGGFRLSTDIRYQPADLPVDARWQRHWHDRDGL